jgi:hypothetical protein
MCWKISHINIVCLWQTEKKNVGEKTEADDGGGGGDYRLTQIFVRPELIFLDIKWKKLGAQGLPLRAVPGFFCIHACTRTPGRNQPFLQFVLSF